MDNSVKNLISLKNNITSIHDFYFLPPREIKIIAVSKMQPAEKIVPLLDHGHKIFGENRVQEAYEKWFALKQIYKDIQLHLIGSLQTNKVKKALEIFDVIQSVDRTDLIDCLSQQMYSEGKVLKTKFFIQVNTGNEAQKSGVAVDDVFPLLMYAQEKNLEISGLMSIPPVDESPSYHFALLQSLIRTYQQQSGKKLQMSAGMSNDFAKAIICQTDYIRIGTALFGQRTVL